MNAAHALPAPLAEPRLAREGQPVRASCGELHPGIIALRMLAVLSLITGVLYPLLVTGIAQLCFPHQASGSLVMRHGRPVGSALLAQRFADPRFFWPRPSAGDDGVQYATVASGASNLGPTSSNLAAKVRGRAAQFRAAHSLAQGVPVPSDALFASGSGLDPQISPDSARLQAERVAHARGLGPEQTERVRRRVEEAIERPQLGFLGEPRVNVLHLNLALEGLQ